MDVDETRRAAIIALAHEYLDALTACDPTVSGVTLILPSGEMMFAARPNTSPPKEVAQ